MEKLIEFYNELGISTAVYEYGEKTIALKRVNGDRNGRFRKTKVIYYVDRTNAALLFTEHVDRFEIVFTGFMNGHVAPLCGIVLLFYYTL